MSEMHPRVSIGVPVFNGESFLAETLDSLLNQTFGDYEIVISDNASTDRTEEICRTYAARDSRIRYYRSDVNRGAAWNHNRVFELATGEFFKWNSADDVCAPDFLAQCVAALDNEPSAVMACCHVSIIDEQGEVIKPGVVPPDVASTSALQRFRRNIQTDHPCYHIYSLIRSQELRRCGPLGNYADSDRVLLSQLSLLGRLVLVPQTLMFNRDHCGRFTRSFEVRSRQGTVWFDSKAATKKLFPYWRELRAFWDVVSQSPIDAGLRLRCYWVTIDWLRSHKYALLGDIFYYPRAWLAGHLGRPGGEVRQRTLPTVTEKSDNDPISVTVILCTHNRCEDLTRALQSIAGSQMPASAVWEVLVVDNNSTDLTREIVEDFCRRYPDRFRYLFESRPGKSYALNAGVANAHGEILAFVDDDVTVESRWLRSLTRGLRSGEWAGIAGRIFPGNEFAPPAWLSWQHCGSILCAYYDLGDQPKEIAPNDAPYGANMAFRKSAFDKYGGFRLDLGPRPGSQLRNEDIEFGRRLLKAGERLRYEPLAVVYHPVPERRITKEFFLSWWFDFGRASVIERDEHPDVCGVPWDFLSLMRRCLEISLMGVRWTFARSASMRFFWRCMIWKQVGMMNELHRRLTCPKERRTAVGP